MAEMNPRERAKRNVNYLMALGLFGAWAGFWIWTWSLPLGKYALYNGVGFLFLSWSLAALVPFPHHVRLNARSKKHGKRK